MVVGADPGKGSSTPRAPGVKVLITGRTGQLARCLIERGADQPGIDLEAVGRPELDLERPGSATDVVRSLRPDVIINTAAYTAVDQAEDEPERVFQVNAVAAGELAEAAEQIGSRIVQISTDYVFDGRSTVPYRPDEPAAPINVYGHSKLNGETRVRAATKDHLIVRTSWLVSPYGKNFVRTMLRMANEQDIVRIVADQWGNPTSALDLADCLLTILTAWREEDQLGLGRIYHIANAGAASWAELAKAIFTQASGAGHPAAKVFAISTADWPGKADRPMKSCLDSSAFELEFGCRMQPWQVAVRATVELCLLSERRDTLSRR
jgi:dTDP-4-dehydrorhamnose reductase